VADGRRTGAVMASGSGSPPAVSAPVSHGSSPDLQHHFEDLSQQKDASQLGMWLFLVTEILFFGGLFTAYLVYRWSYPLAFADASHHMNVALGTLNTAVLIISSLTMAMAVHSAAVGRKRALVGFLLVTMLLGAAFLGVKAIEYTEHIEHHLLPGPAFHYPGPYGRPAGMFFSLYFMMTGLHALHMIIGLGLLTVLVRQASRGRYTPRWHTPVEMCGLYWHFVDIVWIFLFPLLYLIGRHIH
jgi:cytochrome c oxidase subunit 3